LGPYTLVRDRRTVTVSADADPAIDTVMLFGSFSETATGLLSAGPGDPVTPIVMIKGTGINVPGTTETSELATPITGAASEGSNFALHALTVSISCVGSATSSSGVVVLGTCQSKVSRKAFPTFTALSASLTARQEASQSKERPEFRFPRVLRKLQEIGKCLYQTQKRLPDNLTSDINWFN
jgi:hypothetical protein